MASPHIGKAELRLPNRQERVELIGVTVMQHVRQTSAQKITALAAGQPVNESLPHLKDHKAPSTTKKGVCEVGDYKTRNIRSHRTFGIFGIRGTLALAKYSVLASSES